MGFRDLPISEVEQEEELDEQNLAILIDRHSLRLQEVQQLSRARVSLQSSDRAPSQNVLTWEEDRSALHPDLFYENHRRPEERSTLRLAQTSAVAQLSLPGVPRRASDLLNRHLP